MSDSERERSPARRRSPDRAKSDEPKPEEFKCFVGGIPWQFDDERLREGIVNKLYIQNFSPGCVLL